MASQPLYLLIVLLLSPVALAAAGGCAAEAFSNGRTFATCNDLPHLSSALHWTYDRSAASLSLAFVAPPATAGGWVAWAINPTPGGGMQGAQALVAFKQPSGVVGVKTYNISGYGPVTESKILYETSGLAAEEAGGKIRMYATVKLPHGTGEVSQVWQVGASVTGGGVPQKHDFGADNLAAKGKLDLVSGVSTAAASGGSTARKRNVHGLLNAVSWGILLPIGAIIARYLKTFKSVDPAWFYLHVSCQLIGYALGVSGWGTGLKLGSKSKGVTYTTHRNIGIALFSLATLQIFALFLRPNKDHKYRFYWNIYHHSAGYTIITLGIINIFKGMTILSVDRKWRNAYIAVLCVLAGIALILEAVTWSIALKRRKSDEKLYRDSSNSRIGAQQPLSV